MRLPRNTKESVLFLSIISIISVCLIGSLIVGFETGFNLDIWLHSLTRLPFIWLAVVAIVLVVHPLADKLAQQIMDQEDSFNSQMIVTTLCNVLMISILMTVIGTWIGTGSMSLDPLQHFFYKWPRNFAIAFGVEALIAQPIARQVMYILHTR